jgi:PadR family transcriptional regulator PadR
MSDQDSMSPWLRAALPLAVHVLLAEEDAHGYALAQRLADVSLGRVKGGVLYPVLSRLEADGVICAVWKPGDGGPGRKVYSLTDLGRAQLAEQRVRWQEFVTHMDSLLSRSYPGEK